MKSRLGPTLLTLALATAGFASGCALHAIPLNVTPPIVPPSQPQLTIALVPLNDRAAPPMLAGAFHDDLKAAVRRVQTFQVIDYGGPWPASCARPMPGEAVDLRKIIADVQKTCPSAFTLLYEVTQISTVRPLKMGVRVLMVRSSDHAVVLDYDGVWDAPSRAPDPIPRPGILGWILPPMIPPHDPLSEISPRILGQTACRDIALMMNNSATSQTAPPTALAPGAAGAIFESPQAPDGAVIDSNGLPAPSALHGAAEESGGSPVPGELPHWPAPGSFVAPPSSPAPPPAFAPPVVAPSVIPVAPAPAQLPGPVPPAPAPASGLLD